MKSMRTAAVLAALAGGLVLGGSGAAFADSDANGAAIGSPGVLSGNVVQIPIDVPVNLCGNSVNILGILNPAFGNTCVNASGGHQGGTAAGAGAKHSEHRGDGPRNGRDHEEHGAKGDDCP
ncbi:chaplin [Streptomyces sp. V4-01]|uniref:Chaplin n=1 Tax=Actinacidiphila polyblastidii TaxID=3110430 RepID=A0ABU7PMN5_9ACTN|nr:chaplin [Streptomyces sp. V4-01]